MLVKFEQNRVVKNIQKFELIRNKWLSFFYAQVLISLCQRLGFVLFTDKAASAKREPSAEGVRNERSSTSKVCRRQSLWFPVVKWLPSSFTGILQIHGM